MKEDENANQPAVEQDVFTRRPQVEKLNPELINKVGKIISGDLIKEREKLIYEEKDKQVGSFILRIPFSFKALKKTHRMDPSVAKAMERKLMEDGMAAHHKENMTSQEEKIMRAVANDARREAESGFAKVIETQRFKVSLFSFHLTSEFPAIRRYYQEVGGGFEDA